MKRFLPLLLATGAMSLGVFAAVANNQKMEKAEAVSGQPGFTYAASYRRPLHFSDPLTAHDNATYHSKYLNCFLSVVRADSGLDFDLKWTESVLDEHTWISIVLGNTNQNLYVDNPAMSTIYDKFLIKPMAGLFPVGAPGIVKSPETKTFWDFPASTTDGWAEIDWNYDAANKNIKFHVDYSVLNTMSSKTDDAHIFVGQFYHNPDASPAVSNAIMGSEPYWKASSINGTCSGDIALMQGNPLISECDPDLAISEVAPTHTWSVGGKYGAADCISYVPHSAINEFYCEIERDEINKEFILDVHSAGRMEVAASGTLFKDIQFIFTGMNTTNSGGWALNNSDLVTRVYRKSATEMFADIVTGDLATVWTTNESELFPAWGDNPYSYNYANHTIASPKSAAVEDTAFGTHFRLVYDLNDTDLALLAGDFRVQGVPFTGTDGVWIANHTWNLGGNEYFGSSMSDTGDMAFYNSYLVVNSQYFAIQDALHYYFNNVSRDANGSMCSILSDSTRLNAVKAWYEGLDASIVAKLAITPDHDVSVKETLDYIMFKANFVNPHASFFRAFAEDKKTYIAIIVATILAIGGVASFVVFRRKRRA